MLRLAAHLAPLLLTGCLVSVDYGGTEYQCLDGTSCPDGFTCVDERCVVEPSAPVTVEVDEAFFLMGCSFVNDGCTEDSSPSHQVILSAFAIDRTEVTEVQYARCVDAGECDGDSDLGAPSAPVRGVEWSEAAAFCDWVGGRLPTEAEWELAARGTEGASYPWGDDPPDCELAHYAPCGDGPISVDEPIGDESPLGVRGMAGNVAEWVADWYDEDYYLVSPLEDPTGPETGSERVIRGGAYDADALSLLTWNRTGEEPDDGDSGVGFRCAY